jgi:hypothetical protein
MQRRSELLKSEADLARERLASSIEELRSRMSPSHLLDRVMSEEQLAAVGDIARGAAQRVRENPLPVAALAGAALLGVFARSRFSASPASEAETPFKEYSARAAMEAMAPAPAPRESAPPRIAGAPTPPAASAPSGFGLLRLAIATGIAIGASAGVAALLPTNGKGRAQPGKSDDDLAQNAEAMATAATPTADWTAPEARRTQPGGPPGSVVDQAPGGFRRDFD